MIIWQGLGFLVVVIWAGALLFTDFLLGKYSHHRDYYATHAWPSLAACCLAAAATYAFARFLASRPGQPVTDPATGEEKRVPQRHELFFLPLLYWPIVLVAIGLVLFLVRR